MRAEEADEARVDLAAGIETGTNDAGADPESVADFADHGDASLGQRLCAARERHGWSRLEVATRLKLPANLIARLESDNYEGLSQGVFLRGYLVSYARLVGISVDDANRIAEAHTEPAPLVATGTISRSRYLFERYSVSATYLVLTAIIVVPAVWLATHGGLEQNLARTTTLDPPTAITAPAHEAPVNTADSTAASNPQPADTAQTEVDSTPAPAMPQVDPAPVIASMTPFATSRTPTPEPAPAAPPNEEPAAIGSGAHILLLKLAQQSWVEVTTADGRKLEYSMLPAGTEHSYRSDGTLSVRLGNAQGAQVVTDGTVVDLAPFQRGNVAHVKLFGSGPSGVDRVEQ